MEAADYINFMTYDLHGVWDPENPISNQVLAHTNLTEIEEALELLWRNDVSQSEGQLGPGILLTDAPLREVPSQAGVPKTPEPCPIVRPRIF